MHLLADRGEIDLYAPVAQYWPEFGQAGKQDITVADGARPPLRGDRPAHPACTGARSPTGTGCAHALAAAEPWWEPGTAQGYHMVSFGFILGEVVRRVTGRTIGQYLRTEIAEPMGIDVHIGLPTAEHHRCAEMVNKPHIRDVLASGGAPGTRQSLDEHPMAGLSIAMGFVPDDELGSNELTTLALRRSSPAPTATSRRSVWPPSTTVWPRRSCSAASTWRRSGSRRAASTPTWCSARASPTTAGAWATCSTSAAWPDRICAASATAAPAARTGSSTSSTGIGYAYVMNYFDATKCNADPRSTALSDEVYRALGRSLTGDLSYRLRTSAASVLWTP